MLKSQAVRIFGTYQTHLAAALGITPRQLQEYPEKLSRRQADRVRGAAMRLGHEVPSHLHHTWYDDDGNLQVDEPVPAERR